MSFHLSEGIAKREMGRAVLESMSLPISSADAVSQCGLLGPAMAVV